MIVLGVTRVLCHFNETIGHTNLKYVMHPGTEYLVEMGERLSKVRIEDNRCFSDFDLGLKIKFY
jgi:hypothetical protein